MSTHKHARPGFVCHRDTKVRRHIAGCSRHNDRRGEQSRGDSTWDGYGHHGRMEFEWIMREEQGLSALRPECRPGCIEVPGGQPCWPSTSPVLLGSHRMQLAWWRWKMKSAHPVSSLPAWCPTSSTLAASPFGCPLWPLWPPAEVWCDSPHFCGWCRQTQPNYFPGGFLPHLLIFKAFTGRPLLLQTTKVCS